jgi:hypothetical protein
VWVGTTRAVGCQHISRRRHANTPTAIESRISCGRLDPFRAAAAADAKRVDTQSMRGVRNAVHTRLDEIRSAMVSL